MSSVKSEATAKTLSLILAASLGLSACEAPKSHKVDKGSDDEVAEKGANTDKGATPGKSESTSTNPATSGNGTAAQPGTTGSTAENAQQSALPGDDLPQLAAARGINLSKLKDSVVICTVNGIPITVETFKKEYREGVLSLQATLTTQPGKVNELLGQARSLGVELTADEHKRLLETARHKEALEGKSFKDFLQEKKITEEQFNEQVLMLGLAFKTGTKIIESQLLNGLINRELMLQAARNAGFYRVAMNRFIEFKHTQKYDALVKSSTDSADAIKDEIINNEMMSMMMDQITKESSASETLMRQQFEKNKEAYKHGERVKLSHIIIAAPTFDNPPLESIRTQIKKQKPNITPAELDKEEKVSEQQQHNSALDILNRALKGEDFKTLADRYTDDVPARASKTGGDLGYLDLSLNLSGPGGAKTDQGRLAEAVKGLKVGQVAPDLVHTAYGWHIVKLTGKQPPGQLSYDEVKGSLKQILGQQNREQAAENWIIDKRKQANIRVSPEMLQLAAKEKGKEGDKPTTAQ
jgi:hypothetical protein